MGSPLFDDSREASSWITSQCSTRNAVLDAENVRGNPVHRLAEARKSPVRDHKIFFDHNRSRFVLQRWRDALNEIKQSLRTRCDMSAVLNVVRGPVALGRYVATFVEEGIKSLKNECLIFTCLVGFIEFFLARKTTPSALSRARSADHRNAPVIQRAPSNAKKQLRPPRHRACRSACEVY